MDFMLKLYIINMKEIKLIKNDELPEVKFEVINQVKVTYIFFCIKCNLEPNIGRQVKEIFLIVR